MKQLLFISLFALMASCSDANKPTIENEPAGQENEENTFKDGEYTMKQYYFVMLTKGEKRTDNPDTAYINDLQRRHLANIDSLYNVGKILVAGPFGDDGFWRGIFIFDCPTQADVETLLDTDPMIASGWLGYEVHPWWTAKNEVFK
ncbi:MAG: hypothetical protein H6551_03360 [Chitinophagales bacterium]|nr:hypothetical protein [Chitinophagales bacterium]